MPMSKLHGVLQALQHYVSYLNYDLIKIYLSDGNDAVDDLMAHLDAAAKWICRAQDVSGDGGVSRSFSLVYSPYFNCKGWVASYPETTGYIIPTMFDYAYLTKRKDIVERAVRMADWECSTQMENGAVQGGTIKDIPTPAIFNTGQVIFGWVRAYQETNEMKYMDSALKAGKYLVDQQDDDGAWRRNLSSYASSGMKFYTYNTRTAWALLLLSTINNDSFFRKAAVRNIEFALAQQLDSGWFKSNSFHEDSQPALHTIAYCIRGILESSVLLSNQTFFNSAKKAADALTKQQRSNGSLSGRFDQRWEPTVSWSCLTGDAQIAIIWGRLYQLTGESRYLDCMQKVNRYLNSVQLLKTNNPDIYGGISGSAPLHGSYGRFEILNWAVKFFMDALMLELSIQENAK
jgi:hypothetical protein